MFVFSKFLSVVGYRVFAVPAQAMFVRPFACQKTGARRCANRCDGIGPVEPGAILCDAFHVRPPVRETVVAIVACIGDVIRQDHHNVWFLGHGEAIAIERANVK